MRSGVDGEWRSLDLADRYDLTAVGDGLFVSAGGALQRSMDRGLSFETLPSPAGYVSLVAALDGALAVVFGDSLYTSTDQGETFVELGTVPHDYASRRILRVGDELVYADGPDLYRSADEGRRWERATAVSGFLLEATTVVGGAIFVADYWGALSRSTDRAGSWSAIPLPVEGRVVSMASDGEVLFAAIHHPDASGGGVFYTRDLGATWRRLESDEPPAAPVRVTALAHDGHDLYIGTVGTGTWVAHLARPLR